MKWKSRWEGAKLVSEGGSETTLPDNEGSIGKTVGAVARELDLTASALGLWVRQAQAEQTQGKSGLMKEEREELARLRKDLRIVSEERDILKKAVAFFAKQSR
jgi:transposase